MDSGDVIGSRYRLDRKIGQGGVGRIWLAQDERLDRRVAIKFLLANTPAQRARFGKRVALEAKIAASIQHRNVVQIFDFGTHDDDVPYIVMEALTGFTLGEAFDAAQSFSLDTMIHIMSEVLLGLAAVHDAGIVHRDLKPENIFLVKEPHGKLSPKLLDFGISRSLEPETRRSAVTTTEGLIVGTPQYMSPEQASGERDIDKRTDIYSVGVVMFEALAGVIPFEARNVAELLIAVIQRDPPSLFELAPQLGKQLCQVVDRALKKVRGERFAHAAEMHAALLAAARQVPDELDRSVPQFPPDKIRERTRFDQAEAEDGAPPRPTPVTVQAPNLRPRRKSLPPHGSHDGAELEAQTADTLQTISQTPIATSILTPSKAGSRTALALGVVALASAAVAMTAVLALRDRDADGEASGMIVVQAPAPAAAASIAEVDKPPVAAPPPAAAVEPPRVRAAGKKPNTPQGRKQSAPTDPLPSLATSVADAFTKQKARVIECLNQHPDEIQGSPQLTVRMSLDERGKIQQAELLPEAVSNKPVGACVRAAVATMSFPKPDQLTTFRIPLLWRRK